MGNFIESPTTVIVDYGCKYGTTLASLRSSFPNAHLIGLDHSPLFIELGRKQFESSNLDLKIVDLMHGSHLKNNLADIALILSPQPASYGSQREPLFEAMLNDAYLVTLANGYIIVKSELKNVFSHLRKEIGDGKFDLISGDLSHRLRGQRKVVLQPNKPNYLLDELKLV